MRSALRVGLPGLALVLLMLGLAPQPISQPLALDFVRAQTARAANDSVLEADLLSDAAARLFYDGDLALRAGLAQLAAGFYDSAIRSIQRSAALDGWTPAKQVALGEAYFGQGDLAQAIAQWEQARSLLPADPGLLTRLAAAYDALGRPAEAAAVRAELAALQPTSVEAQYRLGLYRAATEPGSAVLPLSAVASLAPEAASKAQLVLDAIALGQASGDEAYLFGRVGLALVQLEEWSLAEIALEQAVALNSTYADAYAYLGLAQDMLGTDGQTNLEAAVKLAPDSVLANYMLALHWRRLGQSAQALPYLQAAQKLDPQNPALAAEMGGAFAAMGDLAQAEAWFTQAVSLAPDDAQFWLLLTRFYIDSEFHIAEPGLAAARETWRRLPEDSLAVEAYGYALLLTGDIAGAGVLLEKAAQLGPQEPSVFYHLGALYAAQSRWPEAAAAYKHALALDPNGLYGSRALRALATLPN